MSKLRKGGIDSPPPLHGNFHNAALLTIDVILSVKVKESEEEVHDVLVNNQHLPHMEVDAKKRKNYLGTITYQVKMEAIQNSDIHCTHALDFGKEL